MHYAIHCPVVTCAADGEPLLNDTNLVPDSYFTATSEFDFAYAPHNARVGASNYWASTLADRAVNPPTVYLQVNVEHLLFLFCIYCKINYVS